MASLGAQLRRSEGAGPGFDASRLAVALPTAAADWAGLGRRYREGWGVRLARGADTLRLGDLASSELVIVGP